MPWSPKQMKAIRAKKHGWNPPGKEPFSGVGKKKLAEMEDEGMKPPPFKKSKKKSKKNSLASQMIAMKEKC